ncbi:pickpocket protein 28-like [Ceratitis capitata]|uniref:pickpocket protein 28-like n=1 Tax=Ceratitis capitata TaxID=7213 RepID=UPI000A115134|nr:pickpocket protein 28-like [Ceratitis capitata]
MDPSKKVQSLAPTQVISMKRYGVTKKLLQKRKLQQIKTVIFENFKGYCDNTSIHGLKYVVNKSLHPIERIFFAVSFICVVYGAAVFVGKIYEKWNNTPMLVSINPKSTHIIDDPFPAVTICNLNQVYKAKAQQFAVDSVDHTMIQTICKRDANVSKVNAIKDWRNFRNLIKDISPPCSKMILKCKYGGTNFNCSEIFRPILTDNGVCCSFNMVDPKFMYREYPRDYQPVDWSSEAGYPAILPEKFIPMKSLGAGESVGLSFVLDVESEEYYCSTSDSIGFKILLHNPLEVPNMREIGLLLSPGRETKIRIQPDKIESERYLRYISKSSRKCLFEDEEYLEMYNEYTQRNCGVQCSAGEILESCGCLLYYVPMIYGNETICGVRDYSCAERIRMETLHIKNSRRVCSEYCAPSCNDLSYFPSFFSAPLLNTSFQGEEDKLDKNINSTYLEKNIAVVKIYFRDSTYRSQKNSDFIGATDFLSNIGGIISLFFGFSFISLAELVYYDMMDVDSYHSTLNM